MHGPSSVGFSALGHRVVVSVPRGNDAERSHLCAHHSLLRLWLWNCVGGRLLGRWCEVELLRGRHWKSAGGAMASAAGDGAAVPVPTCWNEKDKSPLLEVTQGLQVRATSPSNRKINHIHLANITPTHPSIIRPLLRSEGVWPLIPVRGSYCSNRSRRSESEPRMSSHLGSVQCQHLQRATDRMNATTTR